MFRRRREKKAMKEAAKKAKKAEAAAAAAATSGIQLLRVTPKGTQYEGEWPEYPLGNAMMLSRSMDEINELPPPPTKGKKKKKSGLRRAQSLAEDGMLGQSPQERYRPQRLMYEIREAPVYYEQSLRPGPGQPREGPVYYYDGNPALAPTNGHAHPSVRPRYFVASHPRQLSLDAVYPMSSSPISHQPPPHSYSPHQTKHTAAGTPTSTGRSPSPGRAARYRNVHIIPKGEQSPRQKRPVLNIQSTPVRTPSPARSPSPAIFHTVPRTKGKGKVIKVVEGWDEPEEESPKVVQSHEVGVAPTSRVMEEFKIRNMASPYSITISNDDSTRTSSASSSRSQAARVQLRDGSEKRRNKARPVSAAPWAMISGEEEYHQKKQSIERRNGHMVMAFDQ